MFEIPRESTESQNLVDAVAEECRGLGLPATVSPRSQTLAKSLANAFMLQRTAMLHSSGSDARPNPTKESIEAYVDAKAKGSDETRPLQVKLRVQRPPNPIYGPELRLQHFDNLSKSQIFLASSAQGVVPTCVMNTRSDWELCEQRDPLQFINRILPLRLRQAANLLCRELQCHPEDFVWMPSPEAALSTVIRSQPWCKGDRLIVLGNDRDSTGAVQFLVEVHGVVPVFPKVDLPSGDVRSALLTLLKEGQSEGNMPKMALLPHVLGDLAWILPIRDMVQDCHSYGVPIIVNGSRALGHIDVSIHSVGAEYYYGSVSRGMLCAHGVAILAVHPSKHDMVYPMTCSVRSPLDSFTDRFYYGKEGNDYASVLTVLHAFEFIESVLGGWKETRKYRNQLAQRAADVLLQAWSPIDSHVRCVQHKQIIEDGNCFAIVTVPRGHNAVRDDAMKLCAHLMFKKNISVSTVCETLLFPGELSPAPTLAVKVACHAFSTISDVQQLAQSVAELNGNYSALPSAKECNTDGVT